VSELRTELFAAEIFRNFETFFQKIFFRDGTRIPPSRDFDLDKDIKISGNEIDEIFLNVTHSAKRRVAQFFKKRVRCFKFHTNDLILNLGSGFFSFIFLQNLFVFLSGKTKNRPKGQIKGQKSK